MQPPFMKLFSSNKHGQILIVMSSLELSITWKRELDRQIYVNTLPGFNSTSEVQEAFDACTRETVENIVDTIKFADEEVTIQ